MRHVLVPLDGSEQAEAALDYALDLFPDARFSLLAVIDPAAGFSGTGAPGTSEVWYRNAREEASDRLTAGRERVDADGHAVATHVETGRPARVITQFAEEHGVDHVVVGSHGREGVSRLLIGSVAEAVVRRSPVPVTVVR
ncbi:universal stress protein [Halomarina rubra]|uniref:Universal stress protein n=1 Tax=Halomarina rubra TaxID=2071873 RepID=A0ABD6AYP8_9EURY|nr:universal stress protein [Halomarina rubra]